MDNFEIIEQLPSAKVFNQLRISVGWHELNEKVAERALNDSIFSICVLYDNKIIGMARIIGDGALYFYIQDLIVLPEFQGKGVGTSMLKRILEYLNTKTNKGTFVGLIAAKGSEEFFKKYGFIERPNSQFGSAMYKHI